MNYLDDAKSDAQETCNNFIDKIVEFYNDNGTVSDDLLNDYPAGDSYHHENHIDKYYDLIDAADLLNQLSGYNETDKGLWEGLEPEKAICSQAAYTYGNTVYHLFTEIIEQINNDEKLEQFGSLLNVGIDDEELNKLFEVKMKAHIETIIKEYY